MTQFKSIHEEVDRWFSEYFNTFIDIGAGRAEPSSILRYWGVPLHTSSPKHAKWLGSPKEVVDVLNEMHHALRGLGYTHTVAIDNKITIYSENASRVEAIMSRRRGDGSEMDRAAVSFELRRTDSHWIIISTTARPVNASKLNEVW